MKLPGLHFFLECLLTENGIQRCGCSSLVCLLKGRSLWSSVFHWLQQLCQQQYKIRLEKRISSLIMILQIHLLPHSKCCRWHRPSNGQNSWFSDYTAPGHQCLVDWFGWVPSAVSTHGQRSAMPNQLQGPGLHFHGARIFLCLHPVL